MDEDEFHYPMPIYTDVACQRGQVVCEMLRYVDDIKSKDAKNLILEMASRLVMTVVPPAQRSTASVVVMPGSKDGPYADGNNKG